MLMTGEVSECRVYVCLTKLTLSAAGVAVRQLPRPKEELNCQCFVGMLFMPIFTFHLLRIPIPPSDAL